MGRDRCSIFVKHWYTAHDNCPANFNPLQERRPMPSPPPSLPADLNAACGRVDA